MAKILVIDDSMMSRNLIKMILSGTNHSVSEAENGLIGLQMIESEKPDLVFCDLLMPECSGIEVLEALKKKGDKTPVIILTANIQTTVKEQCLELGAKIFLNKPPQQNDLLNAVQIITSMTS